MKELGGKVADSAVFHGLMLALIVAAFFLLFKAGASYLPGAGVGGAIKKAVNSI